jgi:hypothetical protein
VALVEIEEIRRWTVRPGDVLVIRTNLTELNVGQARDIRNEVERAVGTRIPVLVVPADWSAEVVCEEGL